jgi:hypothetical protein
MYSAGFSGDTSTGGAAKTRPGKKNRLNRTMNSLLSVRNGNGLTVRGLSVFFVILSLADFPQARMLRHYHKLKLFSAKDAKDAKKNLGR